MHVGDETELADVKSKRVDSYSVYRFSSVKDRNACLQVVKEIICFNRFCRIHLLPLLNKPPRESKPGLENRVMELANELLLYSVGFTSCLKVIFINMAMLYVQILSYRAMLVTQEESKAALRNKKTKNKRKGKVGNKRTLG